MKFISHRGNLDSIQSSKENKLSYIDIALNDKFDVEIDIWLEDEQLYLGHSDPIYKVTLEWLEERKRKLWLHCKNPEALLFLKNKFNAFFHTDESYVLTSKNHIWTFSGIELYPNMIAVMPENHKKYTKEHLKNCFGICSDYIKSIKDEINKW